MRRIVILNRKPELPTPTITIVGEGGEIKQTINYFGADSYHKAVLASVDGDTLQFSAGSFEIEKKAPSEIIGVIGYDTFHNPVFSFNKNIHFKGIPKETTIIVRSDIVNKPSYNNFTHRLGNGLFSGISTGNDPSMISKIQDIIFDYRMADKTNNFANTVFAWGAKYLSIENCVIKTSGSTIVSLTYGSETFFKMKNCTFYLNVSQMDTSHSGYKPNTDTQFLNCAFNCRSDNYTKLLDYGTKFELDIDPDSFIINTPGENEVVGVYSGDRAWTV